MTAERARFDAFLARADLADAAILHDGDVDGIGAAATLAARLPREPRFFTPLKGRNAFVPETRDLLKSPTALFVLDLGVREFEFGPPTLLVDHHRPDGDPPDAISGYGMDPVPTTSLLVHRLAFGDGDSPVAWKAALGNAGDLGPDHPPFLAARRAQGAKRFDDAKTLLNAAKRSSDPDDAVPRAMRLLHRATSAREIVEGTGEDADRLRAYLAEVRAALADAKRAAPRFSRTEPLALLRFDSPARVHPLLAQSWRGRLPGRAVIAANGGYRPGWVHFSIRTSADLNLLEILARHAQTLGLESSEYGHGHPRATGGALPTADFARLIEAMGF